jgi:hypothetical protein
MARRTRQVWRPRGSRCPTTPTPRRYTAADRGDAEPELDALRKAAKALIDLNRPLYALDTLKRVLAIDSPDRAQLRFPEAKADAAAQRIAGELDKLGVGPGDLDTAQAACGGDLLFI